MPLDTDAAPAPALVSTEASPLVSRADVPVTGPASPRRQLALWAEAHALFIAAVAAVVVLSLAAIPAHLSQDGWLSLVAGRIIAHSGVPSHDYLTVMAHGVTWHDQQWLAQLLMYGLYELGGLQLLTVLYVAITGVAFAMAIGAARALGAEDRHVTAMLPLGAFFYLATAVSIRTQGFAYPLFVATLSVLALEARRPTRRAYLVFPMLILWGNLHGSATLGAGIGMLYGACVLGQGFASARWRGLVNQRGLTFLVVSPLCLLLTPYGLSILSYYQATLFNSHFAKLVSEWQPVTTYMILAVPLLLVILGAVWALGRSGRRTPAFDQLVLALLALGAIDAVRNITWFGLALVILLPAVISGLLAPKPAAPRRRRVNLTLAGGAIALTVLVGVATLARPSSWFEGTYPTRAVATVSNLVAHHPGDKIFADVRFADWLVWHDPALAGRIAYDTSFENLTVRQLQMLSGLGAADLPWQHDLLAPYSVLVLSPTDKAANRVILWKARAHVIFRSKRVLIATKPVT
jgi:MFS family permease